MTITWEFSSRHMGIIEQNKIFIPKMTKSMYFYQRVYEMQSAELFPRLVKKHEINKCESIKN